MLQIRNKKNQLIADNIPSLEIAIQLARGVDCWIISSTGGIIYDSSSKKELQWALERLLIEGCSIEIGRSTLCCINRTKPKFQVFRNTFNEINELYDSIEEAVQRFMELL